MKLGRIFSRLVPTIRLELAISNTLGLRTGPAELTTHRLQ